MQQLFDGGRLLSIVQEWLLGPSSPSSYLQATGALIIANMARNGEKYYVCGSTAVLHVYVHEWDAYVLKLVLLPVCKKMGTVGLL